MTKVKVEIALSGNVAIEQLMVPPDPTGGGVQLNVGPLFWVWDTKVIPAGSMSIKETPPALSGPEFIITTSNETSLPAAALAGPFFVTKRSAAGVLTSAVPALLSGFGSDVAEVTVAVFMNVVPCGVSPGMCITKVKVALVFIGNIANVQVMVPPDPTGGSVQINAGPLFWVSDTKVIPAGTSSVRETLIASSEPRFVTFTVNATSLPIAAEAGPVFVTRRSAPAEAAVLVNKR
jgi:hypothetical protein